MIVSAESAEALRQQAMEELKNLTDEEALVATDQLLSLAVEAYASPEKEESLGLIECQRILYGLG